MAQDFHAAFGLDSDERHISNIDAGAIALAAIQGLKSEKDPQVAAVMITGGMKSSSAHASWNSSGPAPNLGGY